MKHRNKIEYVCRAGIVAALYVVLTLVSAMLGLSSGVIQLRLSEALCILPFFSSCAIPGLTIGCLAANLITSASALDVVFGSLATLIGAIGAYLLRRIRYKWLVPLPNILANTLIIPIILRFVLNLGDSYLLISATVFAGEFISSGVLGSIILYALYKRFGEKI